MLPCPVLGIGSVRVAFTLCETRKYQCFNLLFKLVCLLCHVRSSSLLVGCRLKRPVSLVEKKKRAVADVDNQIRQAILIDIGKRECYRGKFLPVADERWANVQFAFPCVASWYLDHFNMLIEVQRKKMARGITGTAVSDVCISLKRPGSSILPVVPRHLPEVGNRGERNPTDDHNQ